MDDLISRKEAIDFIDAGHLCDPNEPRWSDNEIVNFLKSRPSAEPERKVGRWIPVSERLPEPVAPSQRREWFITSNQYGGVTLTCYEFEASSFKEGWQTDMTILAWMPLPNPWRGEEDDSL